MSCLIIKNDGIGDLILSSGLIADLAVHYGGLDLVTCEENREIAESISGVRRCIYVSRDALRFRPRLPRLGLLLPMAEGSDKIVVRDLARTHYDVAICLRRFIRESSLVLMRTVKADKKYCAWQFPTNIVIETARQATKGWEHYDGNHLELSELAYYRSFLKHTMGIHFNGTPRVQLAKHSHEVAFEKRVGLGIGGSSSIWPVEYWVSLVKTLVDDGWDITIFGGQDCAWNARIILSAFPRCKSHVGSISLATTAERLQDFDVFVGNDTGLMHLASLVVPICLIIQGGGTFRRFFPWPEATNQYLIFHTLECFDCTWDCTQPKQYCLLKIQPDMVFKYLKDIVESGAKNERNLNSYNSTMGSIAKI